MIILSFADISLFFLKMCAADLLYVGKGSYEYWFCLISTAHVEEEYDKVEAGLVHLENLNETLDYQREVRSHHNQLAVYNMKKDHEIQKYKGETTVPEL